MQECTCRKASNNNIIQSEYNKLNQLQLANKSLNKGHCVPGGN